MKKIITFVLAGTLFTANNTFANPNDGNEKTNRTETAAPDSSISIKEEQELLDKIANEAEEMYYIRMNSAEKQFQTEMNNVSKPKAEVGRKNNR
jgi:hypothetical protein